MMPDDDAKSETSFAELIGEIRPVKGNEKPLSPTAHVTQKGRRPDSQSGAKQSPSDRFRRPDTDEPRLGAVASVSDQQLRELRRGVREPEERIDLHGLREEAAGRHLVQRLESAVARGLRCVLVIHGRGAGNEIGGAVLRERLPDWLVKSPNGKIVLAFAPAPSKLGGAGATLVLLRRR
jgi:DNA-nicking Smr family endonuclease